MTEPLPRDDREGVAHLTLNRADKLSALKLEIFQAPELALAGHIILARESAKFGDTHVKGALTPV
jgi:enoyl-CoA hydratase/carnithine racemase